MINAFVINNRRFLVARTHDLNDDSIRISAFENLVFPSSSLLNDSMDDEDELYSNEDYFDFRNYPLNINWAEINSKESNRSFEILETHGYIAVYVYNKLLTNVSNFKCTSDSFLQSFMDIYSLSFKKTDESYQEEQTKILKTILPNIEVINDLIVNEMILKKEIVFIKILLDIYEHYYLKNERYDAETILNYLLPACLAFYSKLDEKDVENLNKKVKGIKIGNPFFFKESKQFLRKDHSAYMKHYIDLSNQYKMLFNNTQIESFVL